MPLKSAQTYDPDWAWLKRKAALCLPAPPVRLADPTRSFQTWHHTRRPSSGERTGPDRTAGRGRLAAGLKRRLRGSVAQLAVEEMIAERLADQKAAHRTFAGNGGNA
jgi:hypothetical protein